jgi:hypothetical protein
VSLETSVPPEVMLIFEKIPVETQDKLIHHPGAPEK